MIWLLVAIVLRQPESYRNCDIIELNHVCMHDGDQWIVRANYWIVWDCYEDGEFHASCWFNDDRHKISYEGAAPFVRQQNVIIRALTYREIWSNYDREADDRQRYPELKRRGLR